MPEFKLLCPACQTIHTIRHPMLNSVSRFLRLRLLCPNIACGVEMTVDPENVVFVGVPQQPILPANVLLFNRAQLN